MCKSYTFHLLLPGKLSFACQHKKLKEKKHGDIVSHLLPIFYALGPLPTFRRNLIFFSCPIEKKFLAFRKFQNLKTQTEK